jgi:hypothetical protein
MIESGRVNTASVKIMSRKALSARFVKIPWRPINIKRVIRKNIAIIPSVNNVRSTYNEGVDIPKASTTRRAYRSLIFSLRREIRRRVITHPPTTPAAFVGNTLLSKSPYSENSA